MGHGAWGMGHGAESREIRAEGWICKGFK